MPQRSDAIEPRDGNPKLPRRRSTDGAQAPSARRRAADLPWRERAGAVILPSKAAVMPGACGALLAICHLTVRLGFVQPRLGQCTTCGFLSWAGAASCLRCGARLQPI